MTCPLKWKEWKMKEGSMNLDHIRRNENFKNRIKNSNESNGLNVVRKYIKVMEMKTMRTCTTMKCKKSCKKTISEKEYEKAARKTGKTFFGSSTKKNEKNEKVYIF